MVAVNAGRQPRTEDELQRALFTLQIESVICIELLGAHAAHQAHDDILDPVNLYRPMFDAALLRARLLIEFLAGRRLNDGSRKSNANDIAALDFAPGWTMPEKLVERLDGYVRVLDKELAHLPWDRVVGEPNVADFSALADDLVGGLHALGANAAAARPDQPYGRWFLNLADELDGIKEVAFDGAAEATSFNRRTGRLTLWKDATTTEDR